MPRANKQTTLTQYTKRTRSQEDSTNHMPMLKLANTEIATTHQTQGTPQQDTTQAQQETKRPRSPTSAAKGKRHYTKITNTTEQLSNKRPPDAEMERTLPGPHQPCARRARSALEHPQPPKLLTLNVRGILANYNTVKNIIDSHQPDVIFLTETKLLPKQDKKYNLQALMRNYAFNCSSHPTLRHGAGVIVATHKDYSTEGAPTSVVIPTSLRGYTQHSIIQGQENNKTHMVGVYMPPTREEREPIYEYITELARNCKQSGQNLLLAGDWNSTLYTTDRSTGVLNTQDRRHASFTHQAGLSPLHSAQNNIRQHTYTQVQEGELTHTSRIDDVLTLNNTAEEQETSGTCRETTPVVGGTLDHAPMLHTLPHCPYLPRKCKEETQPTLQTGPRICLPISRADINQATPEIHNYLLGTLQTAMLDTPTEELYAAVKSKVPDPTSENIIAAQAEIASHRVIVSRLAKTATQLIQGSNKIFLQHIAHKPPSTGRRYLKRTDQKKQDTIYHQQKAMKQVINYIKAQSSTFSPLHHTSFTTTAIPLPTTQHSTRQLRQDPSLPHTQNTTYLEHILMRLGDHPMGTQLKERLTNGSTSKVLRPLLEELQRALEDLTKRAKTLQREQERDTCNKLRAAANRLHATQPRIFHRNLFKKPEEPSATHTPAHTVIRNPTTGMMERSAQGKTNAFHHHLSDITSEKSTAESQGPYPWTLPDATDPYTLTTGIKNKEQSRLLHLVDDWDSFLQRVRHMPNNKQPGPDDIPNELLKILPESTLRTIHKLIVIMWITGHTPSVDRVLDSGTPERREGPN